jgi:hypothetical protein
MNALHQGGGAPINITVNAGGDVSPVAAHRFGQLVVHEVATAFRQGERPHARHLDVGAAVTLPFTLEDVTFLRRDVRRLRPP